MARGEAGEQVWADEQVRLHATIGPSRCQAGINIRHMTAAKDDDIPDDED